MRLYHGHFELRNHEITSGNPSPNRTTMGLIVHYVGKRIRIMTELTVPRISHFPWNKSNIFIRKLTGERFCNSGRVITQSTPLGAPMYDENMVELIGNLPVHADSSRSQQLNVHCAGLLIARCSLLSRTEPRPPSGS